MTEPTTPPNKSPRRLAREAALQGLYQSIVSGADGSEIETFLHEFQHNHTGSRLDRPFYASLLHGALKEREPLIENLQPCLDRAFTELSPVEAAILLIGAYELANCPETPYRVVINEAIELGKEFGGTEGHKYINGVLDKLAARLREVEVNTHRKPRPAK